MPKTVLAVTPDAETKAVVREALRHRYSVWTASSRNKALQYLREGVTPQLVISPLRFENATVLTFRQEVCTFPRLKRVPFLVYADVHEQAVYAGQLRAAERVLDYPFDSIRLASAVDALLSKPRRG